MRIKKIACLIFLALLLHNLPILANEKSLKLVFEKQTIDLGEVEADQGSFGSRYEPARLSRPGRVMVLE